MLTACSDDHLSEEGLSDSQEKSYINSTPDSDRNNNINANKYTDDEPYHTDSVSSNKDTSSEDLISLEPIREGETHRSFNYILLTNGTMELPATPVRNGDVFMGMVADNIVHWEEHCSLHVEGVCTEPDVEWTKGRLSLFMEGGELIVRGMLVHEVIKVEQRLEDLLFYDEDVEPENFILEMVQFIPNEYELEWLPSLYHVGNPWDSSYISEENAREIMDTIGEENFMVDVEITIKRILLDGGMRGNLRGLPFSNVSISEWRELSSPTP